MKQVQDALRRLRRKRYINYLFGVGGRGAYPVLIDKYEPRRGRWSGTRLNAWKHGDKVEPHYEAVGGQSAESRQRVGGESADGRPKEEIRSKKLRNKEFTATVSLKGKTENQPQPQPQPPKPPTRYEQERAFLRLKTAEELRIMKRTFQRAGSTIPQSLVDELSAAKPPNKPGIDQIHAVVDHNQQIAG